jgi:hypothetical protein
MDKKLYQNIILMCFIVSLLMNVILTFNLYKTAKFIRSLGEREAYRQK